MASMMTPIEMLVSDRLSKAMKSRWSGTTKKRREWWFIHRVKGYWLERTLAERTPQHLVNGAQPQDIVDGEGQK